MFVYLSSAELKLKDYYRMESNQLSEDEKKFYEELFSLYDTENRGYIDIDRFIKVTKEKMPPDQWKNDQQVRLAFTYL